MNAQVVVGIGNIYASEALFLSGIHPATAVGKLHLDDFRRLVSTSRKVLRHSIRMGGSTLRDFVREDGQPGYFKQELRVYGRENEPCITCGNPVSRITQNQRSTFFCPVCQPWR